MSLNDSNKVIISRIQNRRGLKQDLPQPLRPGEIGFATDTRQVFIGADPAIGTSGDFNSQSIFETTIGAKDSTIGIADNNIVAFTVPFKKYDKSFFDGITKVVSYLPSANISSSSGLKIFPANTLVSTTGTPSANITSNVIVLSAGANTYITVGDIVTGNDIPAFTTVVAVSGSTVTLSSNITATTSNVLTFIPNNLINTETNLPFKAADLIVSKNGIKLLGDSANSSPAASYDYSFAANTSASNTHILTFRTAPLASEEVSICYYSNTAIIQAIEGITIQSNPALNGNISLYNTTEQTQFPSFYTEYSIPPYRQIPRSLITVSTTTGTGFIGLQHKHIAVNADSGDIDSPTALTLGNLLVSRSDQSSSSTVTVNPANLVFTVGTTPTYDVAGPYNHIYVENTVGYLNDKVFQITEFSNVTPSRSVTVALPINEFTVARAATANAVVVDSVATFVVTAVANPDGAGAIYQIDGVNKPTLTFLRGGVYTFDQSDATNNNHPIAFKDGTGASYTDGVVSTGTPGTAGAQTVITVANNAPLELSLRYYCTVHGNGMGNTITVQTGVTVTLTGNIEGVIEDANVLIVDGSNTTGIAGEVFAVTELNVNSNYIRFNIGNKPFLSNASVQFINYGNDITGSRVQVISSLHGYTSVDTIVVTSSSNTSAINNTSFSVRNDPITANTFFINSTAAVVGQVLGNISPSLNSGPAGNITPVRSIDLRANSTLAEISSTVNDISDWPFLGIIPDSENKIYITHKPQYTSTGTNFRLHEDYSQPTLGPLSLIEAEYSRNDTVKAKLEKWINSCLESDLVNLFSTGSVGVKYTTDATSVRTIGQYAANVDNTYDEIIFSSREEARDFNKLVNQIFFQRPDPGNENIKGLVNLKTNIELQTRSSIALGDRTVSYAEFNSAIIPFAGGNISSLTQNIVAFDTYKIDYSITEDTTGGKYQRIGTMFVSGRADFNSGAGAVLLQDIASDMVDTGSSGNVTFNASLVGTDIVFNVTNTVGGALAMKYIVKRWNSQ